MTKDKVAVFFGCVALAGVAFYGGRMSSVDETTWTPMVLFNTCKNTVIEIKDKDGKVTGSRPGQPECDVIELGLTEGEPVMWRPQVKKESK